MLNFEAEHQIGNGLAYSYLDDETNERIFLDPLQAMQLGAPAPSPGTQVPPPPVPDPNAPPAPPAPPPIDPGPSPAPSPGPTMPSPPPPVSEYMPQDIAPVASMAPGVGALANRRRDQEPTLRNQGLGTGQSEQPTAPQERADVGPMMSDPDAPMSVDEGALDGVPLETAGTEGESMGEQDLAPRDPNDIARSRAQMLLELRAGQSPMRRVPGRAGSPARMETESLKFKGNPQTVGALAEGYQDVAGSKMQTAEQAAEHERTKVEARIRQQNNAIRDQQIQADELQRVVGQQKAEKDRRMAEINAQLQQVGEMKVNPNRVWEDMEAPETIGMAFALALGAFGSSMNGGPNQAMTILNQYIDRDTEKQRLAIEGEKGKIDDKKNMLTQWLNEGNDWQQTEQIMKAMKLQTADTIAARQESIESREDIKLQYRATRELIKTELLDTLTGLEQSIGAEEVQRFIPEVKAITGGWRLPTAEEAKSDIETDAYLAKVASDYGVNPEELKTSVKEFGKSMLGEGMNMTKLEAGFARVDRIAQELKAKYGEIPGIGGFSGKMPDLAVSQDALRYRTAVREVTEMSLRSNTGAAAGEKETEERANQIARIGDLTVSADTALKIYMDARRQHNDAIRGYAAPFGGAPVLDAWRRNRDSIPLTGGGLDPKDPYHLDLQEPE